MNTLMALGSGSFVGELLFPMEASRIFSLFLTFSYSIFFFFKEAGYMICFNHCVLLVASESEDFVLFH